MDQSASTNGYSFYGDSISVEGAMSMADLKVAMGESTEFKAKVEAPILAACLKKGCWMTLDMGDETEMLVRFKDYGFFVPVDCAGNTAIIDGTAKVETVPVADLRHYAMDEGLTEEEANEKYTEDEVKMTFEATGAAIKALQ